ncbi:MAG: helix-turn-helix transcriptional regulator [Victivallales bacterium]|nr:helix-turn-helix transcriptional regulator [Victivallales bacterium]
MVTEKFKKRVIENRLYREENWFNMGATKNSFSRLRMIYFAEVDCLRGKNIFQHHPGLYWIFHFVPQASRRLVVQGSAARQLLPTDIYVEKPITKASHQARREEILENKTSMPVKRYYFAMERNVYVEQMFHLDELEIIHLRDTVAIQDCITEMAARVRSGNNCSAQELSILLFRFLTLLTGEQRKHGGCVGDYEQQLEMVRRFPQNYPTLQSLENAFRVSPVTLRKIFHRFTGKSPMDFVVHARLRNSCWMLTNSALAIREIAALNGYSSAAFYTKSFRKVVGVSPSQYRRKGLRYFPGDDSESQSHK